MPRLDTSLESSGAEFLYFIPLALPDLGLKPYQMI